MTFEKLEHANKLKAKLEGCCKLQQFAEDYIKEGLTVNISIDCFETENSITVKDPVLVQKILESIIDITTDYRTELDDKFIKL